MAEKDYTTTFTVAESPRQVFDAINNVRAWWSGEVDGETDKLGAEFTYRVKDMHFSKQKITELSPGTKVVWRVTDAKLRFAKAPDEWKGTDIVFEIERVGDNTAVRFTHRGLVPSFECYNDCSTGWAALVNGNLRKLIISGEAQPSPW